MWFGWDRVEDIAPCYDTLSRIKPSLQNTTDSCILQMVTSATCFGLAWPSSGLQRLVSINLLEPELFLLILAHSVYKMLIIQEPNMLEL